MQLKGEKIVLKKSTLYSLLQWFPALYYLANLHMRTGHNPIVYMSTLYIVGLFGLLVIAVKRLPHKDVLLLTIFIFLITGLFNCLTVGNLSFPDLGNDLLLFGVMAMMIKYPMDHFKGTVFFYLSVAAFIVAYFSGVQAYSLLTSSGNYVSVLMILSAAIYYISLQNDGVELHLIHIVPAMICFLLSIWARGRGGILSCAVMLVLLVVYYLLCYMRKGGSKRIVFVSVIVILVIVYLYIKNINLIDSFMNLGKWSYRGTDNTQREIIWGAYIEKVKSNLLYLLNGAPLNDIPIITAYNNNTHNSFIQLHAYYGLIPVLLFVIGTVNSLLRCFKNDKWLIIIVTVTIILRGMTDKFIFNQYGMPVIMYLTLYPYFEYYYEIYK